MDWHALRLSLWLALLTAVILMPFSIALARWLANSQSRIRPWIEAGVALPLILPPTVLGYYLLDLMGAASPVGRSYESWFGQPLVFSFTGLLMASVLVNIPFSVMPVQRAFETLGSEIGDAAKTCGLSRWQTLWRIELPLTWAGIVSGFIMTAAHTVGEFGVVLMVGGNIPDETKTISIAIYDRVQAFDMRAAGIMSASLLTLSFLTLAISSWLVRKRGRRHA